MSLNQLLECTQCGFSESVAYPKMPWEAWSNGCPKCGSKNCDVTVILDKSGKIKSIQKGGANSLVQDDGRENSAAMKPRDEGENPSPSDSPYRRQKK